MTENEHPHVGGPAPCDGCGLADVCAVGLACRAFAAFVARAASVAWQHKPRLPSRRIYRTLFAASAPHRRALNDDEIRRLERERARDRRRRDPEGEAEKLRAWRRANPERCKAYASRRESYLVEYRERNRERIRAHTREYEARNAERIKTRRAAQYARDREQILARQREQRRRRREATP